MKRLLYILVALFLVSCAKKVAGDGVESRLHFYADIDGSSATRSIFEGTSFKKGSSIGLFVYHSETKDAALPERMENFSLYGAKYGNVMALFDYDNLTEPSRYMFEGTTTSFTDIYLLKPSVPVHEEGLAVLAYAPWVDEVTSITSIPFTLGGLSKSMTDLMWARQNHYDKTKYDDAGANYKIIPNGDMKNVDMTFRHALALLRIGFRCRYPGSLIALSSISIRAGAEADTPLYVDGSMNAMDGSMIYGEEKPLLSYDYTDAEPSYVFQSTSDYIYVPMLIAPVEYLDDGDYILEFRFNGVELDSDDPENVLQYPIKLTDVAGGFEAGKIYDFRFTLDNYIQFDGVRISDEWILDDSDKINLPF